MKIIVIQASSFKANVEQLQAKFTIDKYIFLGRNASIEHQLKKYLSSKIERINFAELFSTIQYKYLDDYYDFVDTIEKKIGGHQWWCSWLSWKNPWISFFYLRFCQIKVLETILKDEAKVKNNVILVIVEEAIVLESILQTYTKWEQVEIEAYYEKNKWKPKTWLKGFTRRLLALPKYVLDNIKFNHVFYYQKIFDFKNNHKDIVYLPTFIDSRSFRSGKYKDPFLGKLLTNFNFSNEEVVIIPIILRANKKQLLLFREWLEERQFKVVLLSKLTSVFDIALTALNSCFSLPRKITKTSLLDIEVSPLMNQEYLDEWATYSMQYYFLKKLCQKINRGNTKKLVIYPFENQAWERVLLSELHKNNNNTITFGLQNAPCPMLSTRFYFSRQHIKDLPFPDYLLVNGDISYTNLSKYFQNHSEIIKSSTSRPISIDAKNNSAIHGKLSIMVGCSLGVQESIELIIFITEALRQTTNCVVNIVGHPLVNYDYKKLLEDIKAPKHIKMTSLGFNDELKRADLMFFDSSTVGLQAMLYGIQPVFIGHETVLHVNPNEYDTTITKMIYTKNVLKDFVESYKMEDYNASIGIEVSKQYFGDGLGVVSQQYIYDIWTTFKQKN